MTKKKSTILLAIVAIAGFVLVLGVATVAWFFISVFQSTPADGSSAARSFDDVRRRFGAATPILEMRNNAPVLLRQPPEAPPRGDLHEVHVLTWEPGDAKLTTIRLPFWLLRMDDDPIEVTLGDGTSRRLTMTVGEIERYGPALLLDYNDEDGSRVLVWTE